MGKVIIASIKVTGFEILDFDQKVQGVAEINGTYYDTLQDAIDAVPANNTETVIRLIKDTTEDISIKKNQNIDFYLQNHTITNKTDGAVITNNGTIKISNGTIISSASTAAAINNNSTGNITLSGGRVLMLAANGKQALYNDKGVVEITGTSYLSSVSSIRATVQNLASGTLRITGGTIVSTNLHAVQNNGTMIIGIKDGNIDKTSPIIQGATYGVQSGSNFSFYDGTIKGKTGTINDVGKVVDRETGYDIASSEETRDGEKYKTAYLAIPVSVTFDANGGEVSESTRLIESGNTIGTLPEPNRTGYVFDGWFTESDGGKQINENTVITKDETYYAHWSMVYTAEMNGKEYKTLQAAVSAAPNNIETTIKLLRNTNETITVSKNQNIVFDLQDYKISYKGSGPVITNNGTIKISNGTVESDVDYATINNNSGAKLTVSGGNIISTGSRSSVYNVSGTVEISGSAYLSSTASGTPPNAALERGTVQNIKNGTVIITGGTIIGVNQQAISNEANLIIGVKNDGNVSTTSPTIIGKTYGIRSTTSFSYYDGIIKGATDPIDGDIAEVETNYEKVESSEVIDGNTYKTAYLSEIQP